MTIIDPPAAAALTAAAFEQFAALPEHRDKRLEFIAGSIADVVSNDISSELAVILSTYLRIWARDTQLGRVRGADGGYVVGDARYMPDVSYISKARMPKPANAAWVPIAPDLAVEVISPSDAPSHLRVKVVDYLNAGAV
ncbi:MAG: Uma2 family endonuclease, partial [bacterium]|nr:Uma2 family endonuclease [bacterium]